MHLGIDFGTTRTVVAFADRGNFPVVAFSDAAGDAHEYLPAQVALTGQGLVCGFAARSAREAGFPVLRSVKRALTSPAVNPAGDVIVECDRDKGEVYIRPVGDATRPINLFVSSASATYTLLLRRSDTPADTIVIRDKTPRALRPATPDAAPSGPAPSHVRTMKALLMAMASDRVPPDVRVEETSRSIQLWAEARFTLLRLYEGRGLTGEKYTLQNVGTAPMVLAEQEFDRPDSRAGGAVAGIAIEHHNLRPGETTSIYVIRRGGTR